MRTLLYYVKNCFNLPKMLYFLRTSRCYYHPILLKKYDKTVRDRLSKMCIVKFDDDDVLSTQLALPAGMCGFGVSFASLLALPMSLATAFGASGFLTTNFSKTFEDAENNFTKFLSIDSFSNMFFGVKVFRKGSASF